MLCAGAGLIVVLCLALGWIGYSAVAQSQTRHAGDAALDYANHTMVWSAGPRVKSSQEVRLGSLQRVLTRSVSRSVRYNVNVPDLVRRFGARREVALVVLSGTYNSLPPDEGVNLRRDVVAVVDAHTDKVLLLTG
jgi:hypothetical protein